ncbi:hypothetical protein PBCVNY2B_739L [Paramecium bursaria Chlorella virus NY2B]|uniref:Uncharacterized protein B723L n=1 Tax=Paramecium bursaria Chlorella virus NY2A TaxID=46021 RepID=A7IXP8_PBCVN|nr:hypothetical protein NY2A_B723L [Paramecium bursaria Chlorella virus NY2A]ABT15122.1 hypothetical protein NY2A_B723L [Paramecium bursaria Chlorella virus NY2A]AGE58487.1 hypothetical protein PBCVNY2B_739L [Paramecium bursaria Chlorella virus NY2B]
MCIGDVILYDKTRHIIENLLFEELDSDETLKLHIRGMIDDTCCYTIYNNPIRVVCSERIRGNEMVCVIKTIDEFRTNLSHLPDKLRIVKITMEKIMQKTREFTSAKEINKLLDTIPDDYTNVFIDVIYEEGHVTRAMIRKREKYFTMFETSIQNPNADAEIPQMTIVELYKTVKSHKISMGHVKRTMLLISQFSRNFTSVTTTKKTVLFDAEQYALYTMSLDCPKMKYHDELLETSWNPDRLAMCIDENEYRDIMERWK